jgi:2-haloacid dehalogenase
MNRSDNQFPAIIFDFGGVLLDWNPRYLYRKLFADDHEAVECFLNEIGFAEWNLEQDRGRPFAVAVDELCGRFPHHAHLIKAFHERWHESIAGPIEGTVEVLRELKDAGFPLYGLSNWSAETFHRIRHEFEFLDWFDAIIISGEVRLIKPDPRIFAFMLEKIGRTANECIFIDDSLANIAAADRLGFKTILFESPEQLRHQLAAREEVDSRKAEVRGQRLEVSKEREALPGSAPRS